MKQPSKNIIALAVIFFLLTISLVVYIIHLEKQSRNIQPIPSGDSLPFTVPSPEVEGILVNEPFYKEANIVMGDEYTIKGASSADVVTMELKITNANNEQTIAPLDSFHAGDTNWSYTFDANHDILSEGKNTIVVTAYRKNNNILEEEIVINVAKALAKINPGIIKVDWDKDLTEFKDGNNNPADSGITYYKAGVVAEGEYKGLVILLETSEEGPFGLSFSHIMVKNGSKISLEDNGATIEGLADLPDRIEVPGKGYPLTKGLVSYDFFSNGKIDSVLFKDEKLGNVYDNNGCAMIEMLDHTMTSYNFNIPFSLTGITFLNGEKNTEDYRYEKEMHSCGPICSSLQYISISDDELKIAGTADNGDPIFEPKDINDKSLKDYYDSYAGGFGQEFVKPTDTEKRPYDEFIKMHPFLYWKDPFGRWIEFTNRRFVSIPQAEMCKPAIYLYPEQKTELNVKVSPNGGFTYTNPPYGAGWNVEAGPDGRITDLATGKNYEYLFWEGVGLNYPQKEEGWVVKKENLDGFFSERLPMLGMNKKEISDFKDYWLKQLIVKAYYKISFLTKNEFDSLAPLDFSPEKPQTVIRIMMTAEGLSHTKQIPEQKLPPTPVRNGFTVVEWGGTLLK